MSPTAERPPWADRLRRERAARRWTQADAVRALRAAAGTPLPSDDALLRNWKRWEAGTLPDDFYRPLLARTFGTVTASLFPPAVAAGRRSAPAVDREDTLDLVARVRASDVDDATVEALAVTVDRLCSDYPHASAEVLRAEGQEWLRRLSGLLDGRSTLRQHRDLLVQAGWLALLVGCVENDLGLGGRAEATRRAALSLGTEADHGEIAGWAHEMTAWFALTRGDLAGVVAASETGRAIAGRSGVSVQLAGQAAKAWARRGDRRATEAALEQGRALLESLPHPGNLDHHFVVDPAKFDFYAMDCYRLLGEDRLAAAYAEEVLRLGVGRDGVERSPMRNAEARITLGVVAARRGDADEAVARGREALAGSRQSLPSLLMTSRELAAALADRSSPAVRDYLDELHRLS